MKTLIVISVFIGLFLLLYGCVRFTEWFNKQVDRYKYNNGVCRKCGHKYIYLTTDMDFSLFICDHCNNLLLVDKDIMK